MNLATKIRTQIEKIPEGKTFRYSDLCIAKEEYKATAKALERLQAKGVIKKV